MSCQEITDGKNCVLPLVTWTRKSDREELVSNNLSNQKITVLTTRQSVRVATIHITCSTLTIWYTILHRDLNLLLKSSENILPFANYFGPSPNLPLADCMSFSYKFETLRSGKSCNLRRQPEMSAHGDENTEEAETGIIEGSEQNIMRFSPELVDERI